MAGDKQCKNQLAAPSAAQCMDHYGCIYENNHLITLMVDPADGSIVDANRAACAFYGYRLRDFRKLLITDLSAEQEAGMGTGRFLARALPGGEYHGNQVFHDQHRLASGQHIDVEIHTGTMRMLGRDCIYTVIHDISERVHSEKRLRESEERYRDLVELCPEAILVYSGGTILFANQRTEKLFGIQKDELLGRSIDDFFIEEPLSSSEYNKLKAMTGIKDSFRIEQRFIRRHDRRVYDLDISGVPVIYNETAALQLVCRDITQKKKEIERAVRLQEQRHAVGFPLEGRAVLEKLYVPANTLSGDFFIFHKINESEVLGIIGDVAGKGISAALSISALRVMFMDSLQSGLAPVDILQDLNRKAIEHMGEDYIASCCFHLDFGRGILKAAAAGINEFMFVPCGADGIKITVKGTPLGMFGSSEFEQTAIAFQAGDRFCFYSDGMELLFDGDELCREYNYLKGKITGSVLQDDCTWLKLHIT
ncbi:MULTISPECIES: PAS domain S-box protein [unclassified Paenibacillus]|uniref:SpoIIE family protein phosphatase n=1 Tax=unclassified Paenibacillus TaxID=185978 RepID=UPI0024066B7C|nr:MULTISPECIES: PAS domain S-box protein [unclassified Paenibacillus]MDF9844861.1 PAS domain S-box-containing protein [Paenibacillus sp. PastF-2]MDF9851462.1 PAS domain S-box-containing protein [Paenibacillus sp. PastM-2]MDF9858008.1 PAS domain S-box-containing protein [Paenibacillus sp. PastF-1]MDH6483276.1 PAS domain S-box-containing protein [Paenibacillus sp. PastH-2]MDH6510686.1 PAS domain S-box-containing protein [Paenibacillus sp. PastM-3]